MKSFFSLFGIIVVLSLLVISCQSGLGNKKSHSSLTPEKETQDFSANLLWVEQINKSIDSIHKFYVEDAIKILPRGVVIQGADQIQKALIQETYMIDTVTFQKNVPINDRDPFEYEIATFRTDEGKFFDHLVIWDTKGHRKKRLLECIDEKNEVPPEVSSAIDQQRKYWITLCNQHDANQLVAELYTRNAIYFNHSPIVMGHQAIANVYQYMNRPAYNLNLSPIHLELVNNKIAFEIGQCSGSYGGKYILVWRKGEDGLWRILMDSNL